MHKHDQLVLDILMGRKIQPEDAEKAARITSILQNMHAFDWDEGKHPRAANGQFSSSGGAGGEPEKAETPAKTAEKPKKPGLLSRILPKKTEKQIKPTTQPKNFYGEHSLKQTAKEVHNWGNERSAAWKQYLRNPTEKNRKTLMRQYIDNPQYFNAKE